jgi:hypothetical protein
MKNIFKGKAGTAIILVFTVILAGIAIFTAVRLYQLRQQPVAPNVPSSIPKAQEVTTTPNPNCVLSFTLGATPTPTPTGTGTPTPTGTGTPTATPTATPNPSATPNSCGGTCGSNFNCGEGYYCNTSVTTLNGAHVTGVCRNAACPTDTDCNCPGSTPTPTTTTHATTVPTTPALPSSGTAWPTVVGTGFGILVILGSILLAL